MKVEGIEVGKRYWIQYGYQPYKVTVIAKNFKDSQIDRIVIRFSGWLGGKAIVSSNAFISEITE